MPELTRRQLLIRVLPLAAATVVVARAAAAADSCVDPESESLRDSLNYTSQAEDSAARCERCAFFTSDAARAGCGNCKMLSGLVDATGHCDSFSPPD